MLHAIDLIPQSSGPLVPDKNHLLMKPQIQFLLKPRWRDIYKVLVIKRLIFENSQNSKTVLDSEKVSLKEKKNNKGRKETFKAMKKLQLRTKQLWTHS